MATKRKYNELTINKKKEIIDKLQTGASCRALAQFYEVSAMTISNIGKEKQAIMELWSSNCSSDRFRKERHTDHDELNSSSSSQHAEQKGFP